MICKNCGATLPDGTRFCTSCGARTFDEPVVNQGFNTPQQYEYSQGFNQQVPAKKGFSQLLQEKPMLKIILPIVAVLVVAGLIVGGIFLFKDSSGGGGSGGEGGSGGASSYKQVVSTFFEAIEKEDVKKFKSAFPSVWEKVLKADGYTADEITEHFEEGVYSFHEDFYYEVDSEDFKLSHEIVDEEDLDKEDALEYLLAMLDCDSEEDLEEMGVKLDKVSEGKILEVDVTIKTDDAKETVTMYIWVAKVGGSWYVVKMDY